MSNFIVLSESFEAAISLLLLWVISHSVLPTSVPPHHKIKQKACVFSVDCATTKKRHFRSLQNGRVGYFARPTCNLSGCLNYLSHIVVKLWFWCVLNHLCNSWCTFLFFGFSWMLPFYISPGSKDCCLHMRKMHWSCCRIWTQIILQEK